MSGHGLRADGGGRTGVTRVTGGECFWQVNFSG